MIGPPPLEPSREPVDQPGLAAALVRLASRRWPVELRDELAAEWRAELAAIDSRSTMVRWYRRLRFAASLAVARPVEPGPGEHRIGWRETWLGEPGLPGRIAGLLIAPLVGLVLLSPVRTIAINLANSAVHSNGPRGGVGGGPVPVLVNLAVTAAGLVAVAFAGRALARRGRTVGAGALEAGLAQLVVGAGMLLAAFSSGRRAGLLQFDDRPSLRVDVAVIGVATVLGLILVAALLRVRARASAWAVRALAVTGWLVIADLAVALAVAPAVRMSGVSPTVALLWFPLTLVGDSTVGPPQLLGGVYIASDQLGALPLILLIGTAFGLGYGLGQPRTHSSTVEDRREQSTVASPAVTAVTAVAAGIAPAAWLAALAGLLGWLITLLVLTPTQRARSLDASQRANWSEELDQYQAWLVDLRHGAIVLVALAVTVLVARRRPPVAAGVVTFLVLLLVDRFVVTRQIGWGTPWLFVQLGLVVVVGLWALRRRPGPWPLFRQRRVLAGLAIGGSYLAPTLYARGGWIPPAIQVLPAGVVPATIVIAACLLALATACALVARSPESRSRPPRSGRVLGTALAVGLGAGAVGALADLTPPTAVVLVLLPIPLALTMASLIRSRWSVRATVGWVAAGLVGAAAGLPLIFVSIILPAATLDPVLNPSTGDGFAVGLGASVLALAAAAALVPLAVPRSRPAPVRTERLAVRPAATGDATP